MAVLKKRIPSGAVKAPAPVKPMEVAHEEKKTAPVAPPKRPAKPARQEAPKPSIPAGRQDSGTEHRRAPEAPKATAAVVGGPARPSAEVLEVAAQMRRTEGRLTAGAMKSMVLDDRTKAWKRLNTAMDEEFIPLVRRDELPKQLVMRLAEAQARKIVKPKPKGKDVYWCPYCVDWMPYVYHSFTGYEKCVGCGMSTMDYYTRSDNKLFDKD